MDETWRDEGPRFYGGSHVQGPRRQVERNGHALHLAPERTLHAATTNGGADTEYFVRILEHRRSLEEQACYSLLVREDLIRNAVKKNGSNRNTDDDNLLFPPSTIRKVLRRETVQNILRCRCRICAALTVRELLSDPILIDAVTMEDGEDQRLLLAILIHMGVGFAARHICSFHTRGLDISSQQLSLSSDLFAPLSADGFFPPPVETAAAFISIFKEIRLLFSTPKMRIGTHETRLNGENLPFLLERPLGSDPSSFGTLYAFQIHHEFRGDNIPLNLVRKELRISATANEERRTLEFLSRCGRPNLIQMLFWYSAGDKINYVFPLYPGSLYRILSGEMAPPARIRTPNKYGARLKHWMWQGVVDVLAALKFFHFPDHIPELPEQLIAAHFDMKPANVLVDEMGTFIVTDFGQAKIRGIRSGEGTSLTAHMGDLNYQPPPFSPMHTVVPDSGHGPRWSRAYDVWSMACIMTEVIEFIVHGESKGFARFRSSRREEDPSSIAFWMEVPGRFHKDRFILRQSVQETLRRFRDFQDQYLNTVTDLLESMFSVDPMQRPTIADCLEVVSQDIPTDEWPLLDQDEVSICGLGTNPQLRNMHTQFVRASDRMLRRCKMYLLLNTHNQRVRVALEFDREVYDGTKSTKIACVLSDSAMLSAEFFKPKSLFSDNYRPILGPPSLCSFGILHPNLIFHFDDPIRGPKEYYHFLTAVTRQRSVAPQRYMPISNCTYKYSTLTSRREIFGHGHIQIWRQLSDEDYAREFTYAPDLRRLSNPTSDDRRTSVLSQVSSRPTIASNSTGSSSSSSTAKRESAVKLTTREVDIHRLVIFIPGPPAHFLTINLTNKFNKPQMRATHKRHRSDTHICFFAVGANFLVGDIASEIDCPGIPLDKEVLRRGENVKVDWVEIEFKHPAALQEFQTLWEQLFAPI